MDVVKYFENTGKCFFKKRSCWISPPTTVFSYNFFLNYFYHNWDTILHADSNAFNIKTFTDSRLKTI